MEKLIDILRMIIISPEMAVSLIFILIDRLPLKAGEIILSILGSDQKWAAGAIILIPVTLLVSCYKLGTKILSPKGKRKILLEWPGYWRLKYRVVFSQIVCIASLIASILGFFLVIEERSSRATMLIIGAWAVAATSVASIANAIWTAREILGE